MPDTADLIWIQDAEREYARSRAWLDGQVRAGRLSYANIPGDRKTYLLRSELDALLRPSVRRGRDGEGEGEGTQAG